ncbi:MAG: hypothetical protein QMC62_08160 [Alteromonadaceae bacterium]
MNSTTKEKYEIIRKINFEIAQISELASKDILACLRKQLITPSWCLSLDSVLATTKNYESIMNQLINIQLKDVTPETLPATVTPDEIINHVANILIILSFVVEFAEGEEAN